MPTIDEAVAAVLDAEKGDSNPFALPNIRRNNGAPPAPQDTNPFSLANIRKTDPVGDAVAAVLGDEQTKRRATMFDAVRVNPDQAAKAQKLSAQTGVPSDVALRNLSDLDLQVAVERYANRLDQPDVSQTLRNYFTRSDFARMSHDDIDRLTGLDARVQQFGALQSWQGPAPTPGSVLYGLAMSPIQGFQAAREGGRMQMADTLEAMGLIKRDQVDMRDQLRRLGQVSGAAEYTTPTFESGIARGIYGGASSFLRQVPGVALTVASRSPAPLLASIGVQTEAESYAKYRSRGATAGQAALGAGIEAGVEVGTELLPAKFLTSALGRAGMGEFVSGLLAREIPSEQLATILQDAADTAIANPDKTWTQYLNERPGAALETLVATVTQGAITGGIGAAARRLSRDQATLETSDRQTLQLADLVAEAGQSKLRERSPGTFADFVQQAATESGAPTAVYVDARALADALNQSGIPDQQLDTVLPSVRSQIAAAFESGGVVEIPIGEALAAAPGTPLEQVLLQNARLDPEGLSRVEVEEAAKQADQFVQAEADRIVADAQTRLAAEEQTAQIRQTIADQLNAAGRFKPEANGVYATMVGAFYSTTAQRLGVTPAELYARYPLKVTGEMQGGQVMEQSAFHGSPYRFDKFTTEKMGTGEGAQAFGWGMYFAGDKNVADRYRKFLSDGGQAALRGELSSALAKEAYADLDERLPVEEVRKRLTALQTDSPNTFPGSIDDALKEAQALIAKSGQLYEVEIPESDKLLDWDKPLSEQPAEVQNAIDTVMRQVLPASQIEHVEESFSTMTGEQFYRLLSEYSSGVQEDTDTPGAPKGWGSVVNFVNDRAANDKAASLALHAAGVDGIQFLDGNSRRAGEGNRNYVVFNDDAVRIADTYYQQARATFSPSQMLIALGPNADYSSFLHESGHAFLEILADMGSQPGAPEQVAKDWQTTLEWFGVTPEQWAGMDLEQKRPYHERWAESTEQYFFEGKAPSVELRGVFDRFRTWLTAVYKSLRQFVAARPNNDVALSDDIRQVMDRLLATDEQIADAERVREYGLLFKSPEEAGMTPEQWAQYTSDDAKAHAQALADLTKRSLRDYSIVARKRLKALKDVQRDMAEKRKPVEAEAAAIIAQEPVYRAMRWLKKGEMQLEDGSTAKTEGEHKLDTTFLKEQFPEADLSKLRGMTKQGGLHPDLVAEQLGYDSGDHLVQDLLAAFPEQQQIDGLTDRMMLERYGDLTTLRGQERAADEAVHNEARLRVLAAEYAATSATRQNSSVIRQAARIFAENVVARKRIRDLKPSMHTAAERRAGKAAEKALAKGDLAAASAANRDRVLQFQSARVTMEAQAEVDRALNYLRKFETEGTRKALDTEYTDQIDKLLERVELRERTNRELDKRASLAEWISSQEELGIEPDIPANVRDGASLRNYRDMTMSEFRELVEAVKQIEHLGRLKKRLLTAKDQREFAAVVEELESSIIANSNGRAADTRTPADILGKSLKAIRTFGWNHIKAATLARIADGGKDGGPMWERFVRGANDAGDLETTMRAQATEALTKILAPWLKSGKLGGKGRYFPTVGRSLNREQVLAMALNTGNEGNLQRLLDGEGWTLDQVQPVLATLSPQDWQTVQAVWSHFEGYRPMVAELERDVFGKEPEWVEPGSPVTRAAGVQGGYFPVVYDAAASIRAEEHESAESVKRKLQGAYNAATVRKSFTKARSAEVVGRPLLLTLRGVYNGVNDQIHYLAWQRWLVDTNRLLRNKKIDGALRSSYGPEAVKQLRTWRDAVAEGDSGAQEAADQFLGLIRRSVSVAGLGYNVVSALMQPVGYTQTIARVGPQWAGAGLKRYLASPREAAKTAAEKSSFMANRARTRFRELNELRNRVEGQTTVKRVVDQNAFLMMMTFQKMVDVPTWWGAYEKAIADGNAEDRAVSLADQAVIDSQGGGQTKDLAAIERGGPAQKLFTVFYSFQNVMLQLVTDAAFTKSAPKAAANILLVTVFPAVLIALLKSAITPGGDDDEDPEELAKKLGGEALSSLLGMFFGVREFVEAGKLAAGLSDHSRDYSGPAGVRLIADTQTFAKQASQGELDDAFRKASINLAGDLFGLPSAQINRTITGTQALLDDKTDNPAAVVFGYEEPKR